MTFKLLYAAILQYTAHCTPAMLAVGGINFYSTIENSLGPLVLFFLNFSKNAYNMKHQHCFITIDIL